MHDAAHALNGQVVTRQVGGLGVAAERSDGRGDDVGLVRRKGCPVEPELCHEAGFEVVEHDVAGEGESASERDVVGFFEVEHDRPLVAVDGHVVGGFEIIGLIVGRVVLPRGPQVRVSSPWPGRSILITSAPRSPRICPTSGPARTREKSMTRMPSSGRAFVMACSLAATSRVRLPLAAVAGWIGHVNATSGDDREGPTSNSGTDFIREMLKQHSSSGPYGGRVQTRFPPEPNGFLHIGHAKSICLNFGVADEFGGTTMLRFDDTNPETEDERFVEAIQEDVPGSASSRNRSSTASDYFDRLHSWAVELIERASPTSTTRTRDDFGEPGGFTTPGVDSPWRDRSVEENLDLFAA